MDLVKSKNKLCQPGGEEEAGPDDGQAGPGEPPANIFFIHRIFFSNDFFSTFFGFHWLFFLPVRVPEHHAGERPVDQHLPEVVRVPTSREKTIGDETAAGAKNKVLLQKF